MDLAWDISNRLSIRKRIRKKNKQDWIGAAKREEVSRQRRIFCRRREDCGNKCSSTADTIEMVSVKPCCACHTIYCCFRRPCV